MLPPHIQTERNFLSAIDNVISTLQKQHKEEMKKLDEQHNERMKELYNQSEEARIQYEKSLGKANTQIKLAWGAFGVAVASLIATIVALFKTLNII